MADVEVVPYCPSCRSPQSSLFDERIFRGRPVTNRLCSNCGLVYQSPRMTADALDLFYQAEYRLLYQGSQEPSSKDLALQRSRALELLEFIRNAVPSVQRHLDIGCSAGLLLEGARQAYACQPVGIEPGDAYRQAASRGGMTVYPSLAELEAAGEAAGGQEHRGGKELRFDLISLAHVLEHIPHPVEYLAGLRQWLTPNGWLLVEVPNLYGHDCFEVAHLVSYSAHTLRQVLAQAGFQVVQQRIHGQPRSAIIPLYITVLAKAAVKNTAQRPEPVQLNPEKGVRRKRRLALLRRSLQTRFFPSKAWLSIGGQEHRYPADG